MVLQIKSPLHLIISILLESARLIRSCAVMSSVKALKEESVTLSSAHKHFYCNFSSSLDISHDNMSLMDDINSEVALIVSQSSFRIVVRTIFPRFGINLLVLLIILFSGWIVYYSKPYVAYVYHRSFHEQHVSASSY